MRGIFNLITKKLTTNHESLSLPLDAAKRTFTPGSDSMKQLQTQLGWDSLTFRPPAELQFKREIEERKHKALMLDHRMALGARGSVCSCCAVLRLGRGLIRVDIVVLRVFLDADESAEHAIERHGKDEPAADGSRSGVRRPWTRRWSRAWAWTWGWWRWGHVGADGAAATAAATPAAADALGGADGTATANVDAAEDAGKCST